MTVEECGVDCGCKDTGPCPFEAHAEMDGCLNCLTPWKCNGPHVEPTEWHPDTPEFRAMVAEEEVRLELAEARDELAARFDVMTCQEDALNRVRALAATLHTGGLVSARATSELILRALEPDTTD